MSEGGTIAVLTGVGGAFSAFVVWLAKYILGGKDDQIKRLEAEVAAGRNKTDSMQTEQMKMIQESLIEARKRAETDDRVARSLAEQARLMSDQSALIAKLISGAKA